MRRIIGITLTGLALTAALAACSSSDDAGSGASASTSDADLSTADSSLGTIVVDGTGMTAYYFDKDTADSGKSACTADCAASWPAIETTSTTPTVEGVTGTVGTITGTDGKPQLTIDGRPLYTYVGDAKPGDVTGQGVGGIWYVVAPDGTEIMQGADANAGY